MGNTRHRITVTLISTEIMVESRSGSFMIRWDICDLHLSSSQHSVMFVNVVAVPANVAAVDQEAEMFPALAQTRMAQGPARLCPEP